MIKVHIMPYNAEAGKYTCRRAVPVSPCLIFHSNQHNKKLFIQFEETI